MLIFTSPLGDELIFDTRWEDEQLGDEQDEAESNDVQYEGDGIAEREYDFLTASGLKVLDLESNADSDEAVLELPSDILEVEVLVYG